MRPKLQFEVKAEMVLGTESTHSHQLLELIRFMTETDIGIEDASEVRQTWQHCVGRESCVLDRQKQSNHRIQSHERSPKRYNIEHVVEKTCGRGN
jgi:hypothetical protein